MGTFLIYALRKLAKADRRSLSSYIEIVLDTHIETKKQQGKRPKTRN